jgi:hypothetical protein
MSIISISQSSASKLEIIWKQTAFRLKIIQRIIPFSSKLLLPDFLRFHLEKEYRGRKH